MIRLKVKNYCENCGRFEPAVMKEATSVFSYHGDPYYSAYDTTIRCEHEQCCETMAIYLKDYPVEV